MVLPHAYSSSAHAATGTGIHAFLQDLQTMSRDDALDRVSDDDARRACQRIELERLPIGGMAAEIAFAIDVDAGTARELGRGHNRDYSTVRPHEIAGQLDVAGTAGQVGYVGDYKLGWSPVIPAEHNRQIHFGAVALALTYGVTEVVGEVIAVRPGAEPYISRHTFDGFQLALLSGQLRDIRDGVTAKQRAHAAGQQLNVREGEHCRYCPAMHSCPAKVALAIALGTGAAPESVRELVGTAITADVAAEAYRRAQQIEGLCKMVKARVEELALRRPIRVGPRRYLGAVDKQGKERLDGDQVWSRVERLYGEQIADIAAPRPTERKALKKTIGDALRRARELGLIDKLAPAERGLLEDLRKSGGASRSPGYTTVEEYTATECATDGCREQALTAGGTCDLCALDAEERPPLRLVVQVDGFPPAEVDLSDLEPIQTVEVPHVAVSYGTPEGCESLPDADELPDWAKE